MENKVNFNVLKSIEKVFKESEDSKLKPSLFKKIEKELSRLSGYFNVSNEQSLFISVIFALNFELNSTCVGDIATHFDCTIMEVLKFHDDFKFLINAELLLAEDMRSGQLIFSGHKTYIVNDRIADAIINNNTITEVKKKQVENVFEVFEKLYELTEERDDEKISTEELLLNAESFLKRYQSFELIKKINDMSLRTEDKIIYINLIWNTLTGYETSGISRISEKVFSRSSLRVMYIQDIISEKNNLIKLGLAELVKAQFFDDTEMKLSDYSIELLEKEGIKVFTKIKIKKSNVIEPDKIKQIKLFYNEQENKQISLLQKMLSKTKFKEIQERLVKKNLPRGVTVLLYGLPGTGKTETVYQIARKTNREIIKVDISQSKSMWFGESEKIIKRIFTDYRNYAKECELTPILLFNEADAIISKRKKTSSSNISQTENTIQNIILEELENFEGIFFATTNLVSNIDSAFERRFLFKVKFHKPNISVKAKIWKSKLPKLSLLNCKKLANQFNFSGGQINNIVRKCEMQEIVSGKNYTIEDIIEFCKKEELIKSNKIKVGFIKS